MLSLSAAVFFQTSPSWLGEHPHAVTLLYAVALVLLTLTAVSFQPLQRLLGIGNAGVENDAPVQNTGTYVGRDVTGSQVVTSGGHLHIGDVHTAPMLSTPPVLWREEWKALATRFASRPWPERVTYQEARGRSIRVVIHDAETNAFCALAGSMLLKSPTISSGLSEYVRSEENYAGRWLRYLKEATRVNTKSDFFVENAQRRRENHSHACVH